MDDADFLSHLSSRDFLFTRRPRPLAPDLRPAWRIPLLLLILRKCCRGGRSSIQRLHVLNWSIRTTKARNILLQAIGGHLRPQQVIVRFEPSLDRAIALAIGLDYLQMPRGDRIELTPTGSGLADKVSEEPDLLTQELEFLSEVGLAVTEKLVQDFVWHGVR